MNIAERKEVEENGKNFKTPNLCLQMFSNVQKIAVHLIKNVLEYSDHLTNSGEANGAGK